MRETAPETATEVKVPDRIHSLLHDVNDSLSLVAGHLTLLAESSGLDRDQRESVLTALEAGNEAAESLRELRRLCLRLLSGDER